MTNWSHQITDAPLDLYSLLGRKPQNVVMSAVLDPIGFPRVAERCSPKAGLMRRARPGPRAGRSTDVTPALFISDQSAARHESKNFLLFCV